MDRLKRAAAITGIGELKPLKKTDLSSDDLMMEAVRLALLDAELEAKDIDGILITPPLSSTISMAHASAIAEMLGVRPTFANVVDMAGASGASQVWKAASAIADGMAKHVLCITGEATNSKAFSNMPRRISMNFHDVDFESPYGAMGAPSGYALAAMRHKHEYGTTAEMRARIAVDQRANAQVNPDAMFYGAPITSEDVLNSRLVSDPFHLLEIVMPVSGAAAFIVSEPEAAKKMKNPPVWLLGAAEMIGHSSIAQAKTVTTTPVAYTGPKALERAGVSHGDIDLLSIYDCFTIMVMMTIEDAGFVKKGTIGPWALENDMTYKGNLPVNTHGGQLSFGQAGLAGGTSHVIEAVRQLRHQAGERQIKDCELVFVNGNGGIMAEECSLVLSNN